MLILIARCGVGVVVGGLWCGQSIALYASPLARKAVFLISSCWHYLNFFPADPFPVYNNVRHGQWIRLLLVICLTRIWPLSLYRQNTEKDQTEHFLLDITMQSANFGRNTSFLSIYLFIYLFIVMIKGTVILQKRKRKKKDNHNWLLTSCQRLTAHAERRRGNIRVHCLRSPCPRLTQTFGFYFFIVFNSNNCLSLARKKGINKNPIDLYVFVSDNALIWLETLTGC